MAGLEGLAKRIGVDKWIFFTTLLLVVVGLAMVFSASAIMAQERYHSPYAFVGRQAGWAVAGVLAMVFLMSVDYARYNSPRFIYPALAITTVLLVAGLFFRDSHDTHRWIRFGGSSPSSPLRYRQASSSFFFWPGFSPTRSTDAATGEIPCSAPPSCRSSLFCSSSSSPTSAPRSSSAGVTAMMLVLAGMEWKYLVLAVAVARRRWPRCSSGSRGAAPACWPSSTPTLDPRARASTSTSR